MKLPKNPEEKQLFTVPSGKGKYVWNGFGWDRFVPSTGNSSNLKFSYSAGTYKEVPYGLIDGYNFVFSLSSTPIADSEHVYLNGLLQKAGENYDYVIYQKSIYFVEPPYQGSTIICSYSSATSSESKNEVSEKINSRTVRTTSDIIRGREMVYLNGVLQTEGENADYTIDSNLIKFNFDLNENDIIISNYFST